MKQSNVHLLLLLLLTVYCSSLKTSIVKTDSGQTITVQQGIDFSVSLPANPSTGYSWEILTIDSSIIRLKETSFSTLDTLPGSGGTEKKIFTSQKKGISPLKLGYLRSWEGIESAIDSFGVIIKVR